MKIQTNKPKAKAVTGQGATQDSQIMWSDPNYTWNDLNALWGGFYGNSNQAPKGNNFEDIKPKGKV